MEGSGHFLREKLDSCDCRSGVCLYARLHASHLGSGSVGIAVCCSVLQCVIVCYSVLQCVAARCSVLQRVAVCSFSTYMPRIQDRVKL